jgi:CHAD domain-containing protein
MTRSTAVPFASLPELYRVRAKKHLGRELLRVFRAALDESVRRLRSDRELSPREAVHEARRALKRARAALRLVRHTAPGLFESGNRRARRLGRLLSDFRDQDVILESIESMLAEADAMSSPTHAYLWYIRAVEERKREALAASYERVVEIFARRASRLRDRYERRTLGRVHRSEVLAEIERSVCAIPRAFARAHGDGKPERFHKCRKLTQRTLNQTLLARDLDPARVCNDIEPLHLLAKALGRLQDLHVLRARIDIPEKDALLRAGAKQLVERVLHEQHECIERAGEIASGLRPAGSE